MYSQKCDGFVQIWLFTAPNCNVWEAGAGSAWCWHPHTLVSLQTFITTPAEVAPLRAVGDGIRAWNEGSSEGL